MSRVDFLSEKVPAGTVVIYGKGDCRFCDLAMELAANKGLTVSYRSLTLPEHFDFIVNERGYKTVPQIWISDENGLTRHVGGYNEFSKLFTDKG